MLNSLLERSSPLPGAPGVRGLEATTDTLAPDGPRHRGGRRTAPVPMGGSPAGEDCRGRRVPLRSRGAGDPAEAAAERGELSRHSRISFRARRACSVPLPISRAYVRAIRIRGPGCGTPRGRPSTFRSRAPTEEYRPVRHADADQLSVRARLGRRRPRDSGRARARGHHRAGAFSLLDRRREGAQARGAARLRPQRHRTTVHAGRSCSTGHRLAARVSGDSAVAYSWAYCQALEGMSRSGRARPRAVAARARARERAHRQSPRRSRRARQRRGIRLRPRAVFATERVVAPRASRPRSGSAISSISSFRAE